jgi:hypothetical protein
MVFKYKWLITNGCLRLNLDVVGEKFIEYRKEHGNVSSQIDIFHSHGNEKVAQVAVYKEIPGVLGLNYGQPFVEEYLNLMGSTEAPMNRHSEGLKDLIKIIRQDYGLPVEEESVEEAKVSA